MKIYKITYLEEDYDFHTRIKKEITIYDPSLILRYLNNIKPINGNIEIIDIEVTEM